MARILPVNDPIGDATSPATREGIRVVLVEAYGVIRDALAALLNAKEGLKVAASVASADDAAQVLAETQADVVLMDAPRIGAIDAIKRIAAAAPATPIVVLSDPAGAEEVGRALRAGAHGFVSKRNASDTLTSAIQRVHEGARFMCPVILDLYLRSTTSDAESPAPPRHSQLTPREREVLELISQGRTDRQIGTVLSLSIKTVHTYRTRIMEKLDVHSVGLLVRRAFQLGILAP